MPTRTEGETGIRVPVSPPTPGTSDVLTDVVLERHRQIHLWGHNTDSPDGTGPDVHWTYDEQTATELEAYLRREYEAHARSGQPLTFRHFLVEELAEAMKEDDPAKLYTELVQVAAVAVSWCEKIRQR